MNKNHNEKMQAFLTCNDTSELIRFDWGGLKQVWTFMIPVDSDEKISGISVLVNTAKDINQVAACFRQENPDGSLLELLKWLIIHYDGELVNSVLVNYASGADVDGGLLSDMLIYENDENFAKNILWYGPPAHD